MDRDTSPSETISSHPIFPNTLARRQRLGELDAAQGLRDSFSRRVEPSRVMSGERLARWFAADG